MEVEPAVRVALGLHAFGDGLPVVDFGLVHKEESLKRSPGSQPRGLLYVFSQLRKRPQKVKNPDLDLSVRMTDDKRDWIFQQVGRLERIARKAENASQFSTAVGVNTALNRMMAL